MWIFRNHKQHLTCLETNAKECAACEHFMIRPTIQDEFTNLPVSRERKRQLRNKRDGKCRVSGCLEPLAIGECCLKHAAEIRDYVHKRRGHKSTGMCKTRRLENPELAARYDKAVAEMEAVREEIRKLV